MFDFITQKFSSIFSRLTGSDKLSEKAIQDILLQVKDALLQADVPYNVVEAFASELTAKIVGQKITHSLKPSEQFMKLVRDTMTDFMGNQGQENSSFTWQWPATIMVMGLQGSGKTTTIAKLAHNIKQEATQKGKKRNILLASVDFYRPAAIEQLETLAQKSGVSFYRATSTNPRAAAQEIVNYAQKNSYEVLFLDTAGRLHVDNAMIQELQDIEKDIKPRHKLLVIDSMTGQESLAVAQSFNNAVGFQAAVLTKMDSDTKGGVAFAFKYALKKPIAFVGTGEKIDDLSEFHPARAIGRMLGDGDLQTLAEQADKKIKQSEQDRAYRALSSGNFTLEDFAGQMDMMNRLGSLGSLMNYLPGMQGKSISQEELDKGDHEMKRFRAMIGSMTPKERIMPELINNSRKKRIAIGSGVTPNDVTILLDRFKQVQQYVKLFKKSGLLKSMFR